MKAGLYRFLYLLPFLFLACHCSDIKAESEIIREWHMGPLTWDDFAGTPNPDCDSDFYLHYSVESRVETLRRHGTIYSFLHYLPVIDPQRSWCKPDHQNKQTLRFLQTAFDLLEVECRKATNAHTLSASYLIDNQFFDAYEDEFEYKYEEFCSGTQSGADSTMLDIWSNLISHELDNTPLNVTLPDTEHELTDYSNISAGFFSNQAKSSYLSDAYGINLGATINLDRHLAIIDFAIGGSKALKNIDTHNGAIFEDEHLIQLQLFANYGYIFKQTPRLTFYPFAGVGVIDYSLSTEGFEEGEEIPSKGGFAIDAGLSFEWNLYRRVDLHNTAAMATQERHALRIRPSLTLGHFHGDVGWVPAFNLSLSYVFDITE